jgi:hypothetical protein
VGKCPGTSWTFIVLHFEFARRWWSGEVEPFDDQTGRFVRGARGR